MYHKFLSTLLFSFLFVALPMFALEQDSVDSNTGFYSEKFFILDSVTITGNKVTKERVFLNELTAKVGDTLLLSEVGENLNAIRYNLLNTSLFNFVTVTGATVNKNRLVIDITVVERLYWWVMPILEHADRNFSAFVKGGDWSRVRYGGFVENTNFLGRKKRLRVRVKLGYQEIVTVSFLSPQYKYNLGWGTSVDFLNQNQVQVATSYDKPTYFISSDGLGIQNMSGKFLLTYRHHLYHHHQLTLGYRNIVVNDSILKINPNYLSNGKSRNQFLELAYSYNKDTRDSKIYPLRGTYCGLEITLTGSGIWEKGMNYAVGGLHYRRYFPLPHKFYFGSLLDGFFTNKAKLPYFMNFGLGYQDFINGYEYHVIEGSSYFTSQNSLLFNILPTKTATIGFIPWTQFSKIHYAFYIKTFFDFGYVNNKYPNPLNKMTNTLIYSGGVGIDFVTYYDKVFGLSYSITRSGEVGIYGHVNLKL